MQKNGYTLVDAKTGKPVTLPAKRTASSGYAVTIIGARPPSSSGFAYPEGGGEFYVGVFGLKWRDDAEYALTSAGYIIVA